MSWHPDRREIERWADDILGVGSHGHTPRAGPHGRVFSEHALNRLQHLEVPASPIIEDIAILDGRALFGDPD